MASSRDYLDFILAQLPQADIAYRAMMGEYVLYYRGKVFGGIYDDRFLVKPTVSALALLPHAERERPIRERRRCCSSMMSRTKTF